MERDIFYKIFDSVPCAIMVLTSVDGGEDFVGARVNPVMLKNQNKSSAEVIGQSIKQQKNEELLLFCRQVFKSRASKTFICEAAKDDTISKWFEVTIVPGPGDDLIVIYSDVSEAQPIFPSRDYSANLLQSLFNATPDWIFVKDKDFRYIFLNNGFARALNCTVSELLGKNDEEAGFSLEMIYGDEDLGIRGFRTDDTEVLTTGATLHNPYDPASFADGSIHIFDTRKMPVYDDQGNVCGVLGIARDITHRKEIEDALAQSEKLSRALLEATHDAAMLVSAQGQLLAMNGRCKILFSTLVIGRKVFEINLFSESRLEKVIREEDVVCMKGEYIGENVYDITYYPVSDESEKTYQIAIFIQDMTNQVQLAEQLRQSEKMRAVGHLAGGIAHDFNNQLAGIVGYLELLESNLENEKLVRYAKNALRSANRAADLTKQLLAFSRKGKNLSVVINMHGLIEEVVAILERSLDKRIKICVEFNQKCLCTYGDPTQLQNTILNLALNARDAMPDGGRLFIKTEVKKIDDSFCHNSSFDISPGEYIRVTVEDNGQGMSKDVQNRIFEPFFTTKPEGRGVGMGLSAVYGTVNNHNGAITVKSELGQGTSISLLFPLGECEAEINKNKNYKMNHGRGNILIVDDEELVADIAAEMLSELGYKVTAFYTGKEALDFYKKEKEQIDLVIFDMVMPSMNGMELFQELLKIDPEVKGIIISGYGIDGQIQGVIDAGAKGFIAKPFTFEELSAEVKKQIN